MSEIQKMAEIIENNSFGVLNHKKRILTEAAAALYSAGYKKVKVKPPEWEKRTERDYIWRSGIGRFWVYEDEPGLWITNFRAEEIGSFSTPEESQAAAYQHYESLILNCLI